jgi:hypothetical protein
MQNIFVKKTIPTGLLFIFVAFAFINFQFTVDDSFITYRYAKNLVEYGIWNWNISRGVY